MPLNHSVYDSWQRIDERKISNDGRFIAYTVLPQEGDGVLVIQSLDQSAKTEVPRGYNATITEDNRFVVFKIKPFFKDTREARIKKKSPADMPKDSLGILDLTTKQLSKWPRVKSYKTPELAGGWVAWLEDKQDIGLTTKTEKIDSVTRILQLQRIADSLLRVADSLRNKATEAQQKGLSVLQSAKKDIKATNSSKNEEVEEGTTLVLKNLQTNESIQFPLTTEYAFNKLGTVLLIETSRKKNDSLLKAKLFLRNLATGNNKLIFESFNDAKNFAVDEAGTQVAFVAERDSSIKALRKWYKLYFYNTGMETAQLRADGVPAGMNISPDYALNFSKDGTKLYLGLSPIRPVKDTSLVDFETARLDIWNHKDDYLQPQQLVQVNNELKRSYVGVLHQNKNAIVPLGDEYCENVFMAANGNGSFALGTSSKGYRIQQQWTQNGWTKLYVINIADGSKKQIADKVRGGARFSASGKYIIWFDAKLRHYFAHEVASGTTKNITQSIKVPLYDEEDDHPDDAPAHGIMAWEEKDRYVLIYDKYDIWQCDPTAVVAAKCITNSLGRKLNYTFRYNNTNPDELFVKDGASVLLHVFDHKTKGDGWYMYQLGTTFNMANPANVIAANVVSDPLKAKQANTIVYLKENPASKNIYVANGTENGLLMNEKQVSSINLQQHQYNWFTTTLHRWKMLDGKMSEGILYKPENFDENKKYPVIFYFYERNADDLNRYIEPSPGRASVNIAFYTSNGYLVFDPNIYYKTGQPGEDAYNSVVSAAKYLSAFKYVDAGKLGLQGHSWGGYQIAYLITRTNLFAAAEAGAPVSNMTSAYGGIRWGTGVSRQFQYEHTQSRLGASLWENRELYIKNSPLFNANKVNTPLLMMHNDKDDAVPWYQGIEYFSALKRLGKTVYLINYNDELHGLIERKNRKDWTIRMAQFFDHYLKGAPAPAWMSKGVPAVSKGIDWGLE